MVLCCACRRWRRHSCLTESSLYRRSDIEIGGTGLGACGGWLGLAADVPFKTELASAGAVAGPGARRRRLSCSCQWFARARSKQLLRLWLGRHAQLCLAGTVFCRLSLPFHSFYSRIFARGARPPLPPVCPIPSPFLSHCVPLHRPSPNFP